MRYLTMENKEKNFISAVVYVRNDEKNIGVFLEMLLVYLESRFEHYEIVCVDDDSTDGSIDEIRRISKQHADATISIIGLSYFQGTEAAMNAGVDISIGDFVLEFDKTSLDFDADLIHQVYRKSLEGNDIVYAVPSGKNAWTSKIFYALYNAFTPKHVRLFTSSFNIISRRGINRVKSITDKSIYRKALYAQCGLPQTSVSYLPKTGDEHKKETGMRINLAVDSLAVFTTIAYRFSLFLSLLMVLFSLMTVIYTVVVYLGTNKPVEGWTPIMLFLSISFFFVFGLFAVIIKYFEILTKNAFNKRSYVISGIEKLGR